MFMQINRERSVKKHLSSAPDVDLFSAPLRTFLQGGRVNYDPLKRKRKLRQFSWTLSLFPAGLGPLGYHKNELHWAPQAAWMKHPPPIHPTPKSKRLQQLASTGKEMRRRDKASLAEWMPLAANSKALALALHGTATP